jgi:hypothetical protein
MWDNSADTRRIFIKYVIWVYLDRSLEKIQVSLISDKKDECFTWRPMYTFHQIVLTFFIMRKFETKVVVNIRTIRVKILKPCAQNINATETSVRHKTVYSLWGTNYGWTRQLSIEQTVQHSRIRWRRSSGWTYCLIFSSRGGGHMKRAVK